MYVDIYVFVYIYTYIKMVALLFIVTYGYIQSNCQWELVKYSWCFYEMKHFIVAKNWVDLSLYTDMESSLNMRVY